MVSDEDEHVHGVAHCPDRFVGLRLYDETYQEAVDEGSAAERLIDREEVKAEALEAEADGEGNEETSETDREPGWE